MLPRRPTMAFFRVFLQMAVLCCLMCCITSNESSSPRSALESTHHTGASLLRFKRSGFTAMVSRVKKAMSQNQMSCMTPEKFVRCCVRILDRMFSFFAFVWDMYDMMGPVEPVSSETSNER